MFRKVGKSSKILPGPATVYFETWLAEYGLTVRAQKHARRVFDHLMAFASPLGRLKATPQTPPFHAEGDMVADHIIRSLAGLYALEQGSSLAIVEEFTRHKDYLLEFQALENQIKSNFAFLSAYTLCHDIAKPDVVSFEAEVGSKGELEGFASRTPKLATEPEKVRYDKLRRAHQASGISLSFYDAYKITVHYAEHARLGAADEYASTRQAVLQALDVPVSMSKLLTELIRLHMDVIHAFKHGPDPIKYKAFAAIANRAGLNVTVFLDFLPVTLFLDVVFGSLVYVNGEYRSDTQLLINLFKSEREAMPERHVVREQAWRRGHKLAVREALQEANIDADAVFDLLKTPYGPVRGTVMAKIHDLIRDPERQADFGEQTNELRTRARVAHKLLQERHLTLE